MAKSIGDTLKQLRLKAGYQSLGELYRVSGVQVSTLSRIEACIQRPRPETLEKLAPYLRVSYEYLMGVAGYLQENTTKMELSPQSPQTQRLYKAISRAKDLPDENIEQVADTLEALIKHHKEKVKNKGGNKKP